MRKIALLMFMGTPFRGPVPGALAAVVAAALLAGACNGPGTVAGKSPSPTATSSPSDWPAPFPTDSPSASPSSSPSPTSSPSPLPSPSPVTAAYGVLVTPPTAATYTVSLIGIDGKVAASAQASSPAQVSCGGVAAAPVPLPVSTSNSRAYFMDAQGVVRFLAPNGSTGSATSVPTGSGVRSSFAVSPDDGRIAVVVATYSSSGAATNVYVEDLNGGTNHVAIFTETGAFSVWPIGWHGTNNLVLAKVPSCTSGTLPFSAGPIELHVVDPATGVQRYTLGGPGCVIAGRPSSYGVVCEDTAGYTSLRIVNWTGGVFETFNYTQGAVPIYLSPQALMAIVSNGTTQIWTGPSMNMQACEWVDSFHLLAGGDAQQQPRMWDYRSANAIPVPALGSCAGSIPGAL
jgi:hypothetical protein